MILRCENISGARIADLFRALLRWQCKDLDSMLVFVNGNDLLPPLTPDSELRRDIGKLVEVAATVSKKVTFLVANGSSALLAKHPDYDKRVESFRAMFAEHEAHVDPMVVFSSISYFDSLHYRPEEVPSIAPLVLDYLCNAPTLKAPTPSNWFANEFWPKQGGTVVMKRSDDSLYYAHCILCDKRANSGHMGSQHDAKGFDDMMG